MRLVLHNRRLDDKNNTGDFMNTENLPLYKFLYKIAVPLFALIFRPTVDGGENIPDCGGAILAGNHKSNLDCILAAYSTRRCIHFLAKDELFKGVFAKFFRALGAIPVNRRKRDADALSSAESVLRSGGVVGIFPEGRFNRSGQTLLPLKPGAARMAARCEVPIVPFVIVGGYKIVGRRVKIKILTPIASTDAPSLTKELENNIRAELEQKNF